MQGSSYAPLQFLRSPWNRDVYTAIDNQVDGRTTLVLYLGSASTLPDELQKYNVGCILIHKDEKQIYLNTGNDTTPTWSSFGPGTNTLPTPFLSGYVLTNDGVDAFWSLVDLATMVTGLLDSDNIDLSDLANNQDFIDYLIANSYFTTSLANDTNFITELLDNATFISNLITEINTSGLTEVVTDGVTIIGDGTTASPLQAIGASPILDIQENGVSVENPVDTINIIAPSGTVTSPSAGVVDIDLSSLIGGGGGNLLYDSWDDFLSSIYTVGSSNEFSSISILNWTGRASGGNSIGQYLNGEADHPGIFQLKGSGSNNATIYLGDPDNVIYPISEFAQSGNEYNFTVRCNDTTSQTSAAIIKIGETTSVFSTSVTNNEIQIIFDTTNNDIIFSTRDSTTTQSTTIKSSFTTAFYNFRVVCSGTDIKCYVDDILEATHSTNIPATNVSGSVVFTALNGEELDIDFFGMKYGRELSGSGNSETISGIAAQDIDAGDAVFLSTGEEMSCFFNGVDIEQLLNSSIGGQNVSRTLATVFTVPFDCHLDYLPFVFIGRRNPVWTLELRDVVGGVPGSTVIASTTGSTDSNSSLAPTFVELALNIDVNAGEQYALVFSFTSENVANTDMLVHLFSPSITPNPTSQTPFYYNGTSWISDSNMLPATVVFTLLEDFIYKTDTSICNSTFGGFATGTVARGGIVTAISKGTATVSGLVSGDKYYLSNSISGGITNTKNINEAYEFVGKAISSSLIEIGKGVVENIEYVNTGTQFIVNAKGVSYITSVSNSGGSDNRRHASIYKFLSVHSKGVRIHSANGYPSKYIYTGMLIVDLSSSPFTVSYYNGSTGETAVLTNVRVPIGAYVYIDASDGTGQKFLVDKT